MSSDAFDAIPVERRDTAQAAVAAAFDRATVTALRPVAGGASGALTYRIEVSGRPYLLRMETRRSPLYNPHQYACMRIAVEAGIAPPLRHLDAEQGVAIMDFVTQRPLQEYPGGPSGLARDAGLLIRRLQESPPFPAIGRGYLDVLDRMLTAVAGSRLFAAGLLAPHLAGLERIRGAYPVDESALVSSHNDPNPRNVLFDGERLWLVDWETSYRNDSVTDVALMSLELVGTPELQAVMLRGWLGREPDRATHARFTLMRQLGRLYYACLIFAGFAGRLPPEPDGDLKALSVPEFVALVQRGDLRIGMPETAYAWGKMFLAAFLDGLTAPGFEEALAAAAGAPNGDGRAVRE